MKVFFDDYEIKSKEMIHRVKTYLKENNIEVKADHVHLNLQSDLLADINFLNENIEKANMLISLKAETLKAIDYCKKEERLYRLHNADVKYTFERIFARLNKLVKFIYYK